MKVFLLALLLAMTSQAFAQTLEAKQDSSVDRIMLNFSFDEENNLHPDIYLPFAWNEELSAAVSFRTTADYEKGKVLNVANSAKDTEINYSFINIYPILWKSDGDTFGLDIGIVDIGGQFGGVVGVDDHHLIARGHVGDDLRLRQVPVLQDKGRLGVRLAQQDGRGGGALHLGQIPGPDDGRAGGIGVGGFVAENFDGHCCIRLMKICRLIRGQVGLVTRCNCRAATESLTCKCQVYTLHPLGGAIYGQSKIKSPCGLVATAE